VSTRPDPSQPHPGVPLRQRLRAALPAAMKAADRVAVAALRSALAAIENAEAVDASGSSGGRGLAIEQSPVGVGAAEATRRALTEAQVEQIVRTEVAEREAAVAEYDRAGRPERAARLHAEAAVLSRHLSPPAGGRAGAPGLA
jgi:uncharacterized protein